VRTRNQRHYAETYLFQLLEYRLHTYFVIDMALLL
jgi:hypothetical protein